MRSLLLATLWLASPAALADEAPQVDPVARYADALAERAGRELPCTDEPLRFLCALTELPGEPTAVPDAPLLLAGLRFGFRPSRPLAVSALQTAEVVTARLSKEASGVYRMRPDTDVGTDGAREVAKLLGDLLRGDLNGSFSSPILDALLASVPTEGVPLASDALGATYEGEFAARVYRVNHDGRSVWIVLEKIGGAARVSMYPEVTLE